MQKNIFPPNLAAADECRGLLCLRIGVEHEGVAGGWRTACSIRCQQRLRLGLKQGCFPVDKVCDMFNSVQWGNNNNTITTMRTILSTTNQQQSVTHPKAVGGRVTATDPPDKPKYYNNERDGRRLGAHRCQ